MFEQLEGVGAGLQVGSLRLGPSLGLGPQVRSAGGLRSQPGSPQGLGLWLGPASGLVPFRVKAYVICMGQSEIDERTSDEV